MRTETPERQLWAPSAGRVDVTVSASTDDGCMVAAWLVGAENLAAAHCGEICIFEIDADAIGPRSRARCGVKAHGDATLVTEMTEVAIPLDASRPHTWSATWGPTGTAIACEGAVVVNSTQAPDHPMILMLDLSRSVAAHLIPACTPRVPGFTQCAAWGTAGPNTGDAP